MTRDVDERKTKEEQRGMKEYKGTCSVRHQFIISIRLHGWW